VAKPFIEALDGNNTNHSDQDTILAEIFIAAPPTRVFEAIADVSNAPNGGA
jgi:hypothetical protein